jgi:hypothetical protein
MAVGFSPEFTSAYMQAQQAKGDLLNKRYGIDTGGPFAPTVLPPDYNPNDINLYTDPNSKFYSGGPLVNRPQPGVPAQSPYQGMLTPYQNYNPYGSPYAPMAPQQPQMRDLPRNIQDLNDVRFTSRAGATGRGEGWLASYIGDVEGNADVMRRRLQRAMDNNLLSYAEPLPTAQPQQGMFSPYMMPQMPYDFGGVNYPQFNMFNPYTQGMFNPFMAYGSPYGSNV